jgi:hypothetical protein
MTADHDPLPPPSQASPFRRVFHATIALAGWVLFVYWWWIVFQRVSSEELRFTALFIGLSLVIVVAATAAWAWHNVRIFRRRGPRKQVRLTPPKLAHDYVGRAITITAGGLGLREAPVVLVRVVELGKTYDTAAAIPAAAPRERRG